MTTLIPTPLRDFFNNSEIKVTCVTINTVTAPDIFQIDYL